MIRDKLLQELNYLKNRNFILDHDCRFYSSIVHSFVDNGRDNAIKKIIEDNRNYSLEVDNLNSQIIELKKTIEDLKSENTKDDIVYKFDIISSKPSNITWEQYYMGIALFVRMRSKDPCTKVGACIVLNNRIISTGYNGFPNKLDDNKFPWTKDSEDETENKYYYVVHAEENAILSAKRDLEGATLYVTLFPCNECAKSIIQSGIKKVIYYQVYNDGGWNPAKEKKIAATQKMFEAAGITYYHYNSPNTEVTIKV